MTFEQRKQERQALIDHLLAQDWNVFGTLKFVNGRTIGRETANTLLRSYWNRIDRSFFGKAAERQNMRVPRWCFAHEGGDTENYHIHFALQAPIPDVDHMCCTLNAVWAQHHNQTAPLAKNWIMPVTDRTAVASYLTREYWRLGSDTFLDAKSWDDRAAVNAFKDYNHLKQANRLSRAASPLWLRQAQQALGDQKAAYEAQADLQMMERG
jgi:ribosomal protein L39E